MRDWTKSILLILAVGGWNVDRMVDPSVQHIAFNLGNAFSLLALTLTVVISRCENRFLKIISFGVFCHFVFATVEVITNIYFCSEQKCANTDLIAGILTGVAALSVVYYSKTLLLPFTRKFKNLQRYKIETREFFGSELPNKVKGIDWILREENLGAEAKTHIDKNLKDIYITSNEIVNK